MNHQVLYARQGIYDHHNNLAAFELLYRGQSEGKSARELSDEVLINLCTGLIEENVSVGKPLFLKVDEGFLLSGDIIPCDPSLLVLELLDSVPVSEDVLVALRRLTRQGFTVAMCDHDLRAERDPLRIFATVIKIDIQKTNLVKLKRDLRYLDVKNKSLLAEKIETEEEFVGCAELGFTLFQGYHLERPIVETGKVLTLRQKTLLLLLSELCRSDVSVTRVTELIGADPTLAINLLRVVNSPVYQFQRKISHIKDAVILLGIDAIKQWTLILSIAADSSSPSELFRTLLVRAKTCEHYAASKDHPNPSMYFLIGLLSGLDALLRVDLQVLLANLSLAQPICDELLPEDVSKKTVLGAVRMYERQQFAPGVTFSSATLQRVSECYRESVAWADEIIEYIQ